MKKLHVYMMPGLAANPSIFEYISLPENSFETHWLTWEIPYKGEPIESYAKRMTDRIVHPDPILVGVSFGGIIVQEMSRHINVKKLIIVSSVKHHRELPRRMRIARTTKAYKLLPTSLVNNFESLAKYAMGEHLTKRADLYRKYLSIRDKQYLDWSISQVVNWKQKEPEQRVIHIHGEKDTVFPINHIGECIKVKGGTHTMIIHKYKWFNENLPKLMLA